MPSYSDDAVINSEKLVHLDCDSTDSVVFLAPINKTRKPPSYTWTELQEVLKLGERFHFTHLPDLVHLSATCCLKGDNATAIFRFANIHGFPDLAK